MALSLSDKAFLDRVFVSHTYRVDNTQYPTECEAVDAAREILEEHPNRIVEIYEVFETTEWEPDVALLWTVTKNGMIYNY